MSSSEQKKSELFQKVLNEDADSVVDLLELERPLVYDYLLRMTGQVSRSEESIEELYRVISPQAQQYETWPEFKFLIYSTARSFNSDIWNAETNFLVNSALDRIDKDQDKFKIVDDFVKQLPGAKREILIGVFLYGFTVEQLSKLVRRPLQKVSEEGNDLLGQLANALRVKPDDVSTFFQTLPLHPIVSVKSHSTVALSQVMEKMEEVEKKAKKTQLRRFFIFFFLLIVVGIVTYYLGLMDGIEEKLPKIEIKMP